MTQREQPEPPFPEQHLEKPGLESELEPKPRFKAPPYRGADKLSGAAALVTGGDSGIGRAVAVLFAREGADVALVYLPAEQNDAEPTRHAVEAEGGRAELIAGDVRDSGFCRGAVARTLETFGRLDVLVNNAAYQQHREGIDELTEEQWDLTMRTNIYGYFFMAKAAVPHLPPGGSILNTGSIVGLEGRGRLIDYGASKGAIHTFTKSLAQDLVGRGIRVNCVAPGPVWTPGPARGNRSGIRLPRVKRRLELYHRRGADPARRRDHGRLTASGSRSGHRPPGQEPSVASNLALASSNAERIRFHAASTPSRTSVHASSPASASSSRRDLRASRWPRTSSRERSSSIFASAVASAALALSLSISASSCRSCA